MSSQQAVVDRADPASPDPLPGRAELWSFPLLLLVALVVLVAFDLNGSSTGVLRLLLHRDPDPDLLLGTPRGIRSDEWLAQSGWVVSQVAQGFPATNRVFPGGMDATVMNDLPAWDWSMVFRPHTWGFLLLGLDRGMAVRWWLPAFLLAASIHQFVVTMLPRRALLGIALALAALVQPVVAWWWLPIMPNPMAFGFATMTALVWGVRARSRMGRWVPAVFAGYLACDMAMSIYVPFMIPALLACLAFVVGFLGHEWRSGARPAHLLRVLVPLATCGVGAAIVLGGWLLTRRDSVSALTSTVYPGGRLIGPGSSTSDQTIGLLSAPFQRTLQFGQDAHGMGGNQSEASSALLVSLFLVLPLVSVAVLAWRRHHRVDWLIVAILAVQALVLAYLYVPGWDPVAHLVGLDRGAPQRMRLFFVMMMVVTVVVLVRRLADLEVRCGWPVAAGGGATVLLVTAWPWHELRERGSDAATSTVAAAVVVVVTVAVVLLARRRALAGGSLLLAASLVLGAGVNPLNRGVFDLRETEVGRAVAVVHDADPRGRWVGVNTYLSMAVLVESGVTAYGGVQTYPPDQMWRDIDPRGGAEEVWNRLAHVYWLTGAGEPAPRLPPGTADQIHLTFDPCSVFAQQHVDYVLADVTPLEPACLELVSAVSEGIGRQWIYQVVPAEPGTG